MKICSDVVSYGSNTLLAGEPSPPFKPTDVCLATFRVLGLEGIRYKMSYFEPHYLALGPRFVACNIEKKVWAQDLRLFSVLLTVLTYFSTTLASGMEALGTTEVEEGSSEVERWRLRLLELRRKESLSLLEPERVSTGSSGGGLIFTLA